MCLSHVLLTSTTVPGAMRKIYAFPVFGGSPPSVHLLLQKLLSLFSSHISFHVALITLFINSSLGRFRSFVFAEKYWALVPIFSDTLKCRRFSYEDCNYQYIKSAGVEEDMIRSTAFLYALKNVDSIYPNF